MKSEIDSTGEKYFIETYGCQMNEHDSEKMAALLQEMGMTQAASAEDADVVIINTCSVREKPEQKVYSAVGRLKAAKRRNPSMVTVVAGCVAQQEKERLLQRAPHLDVVLGTHSISRLPEIIGGVRDRKERTVAAEFRRGPDSLSFPAPVRGDGRVCSFVTIMQGCSNFCSYCVVPFTRGPEVSRREIDVEEEVRRLVDQGVKEVTLLGQNVNAYGLDLDGDDSFAGLLERLDRIPGLLRIRFTTSHPKDFNESLARAMGEVPSVCPHIHLPLQSGSDRILKAMRRGYSYAEYRDKVRLLRDKVPGVALTADMIVGFPGETEEDFRETMRALEEIRYDQIFSFKYSQRPKTAARNLPDQVPEETKARRLAEVHALQDAITEQYHKEAEGTIQEALIEGIKKDSGQPFGRTATNKVVNLDSSEGVTKGDLVKALILRGLKHSLLGRKIPDDPSA